MGWGLGWVRLQACLQPGCVAALRPGASTWLRAGVARELGRRCRWLPRRPLVSLPRPPTLPQPRPNPVPQIRVPGQAPLDLVMALASGPLASGLLGTSSLTYQVRLRGR